MNGKNVQKYEPLRSRMEVGWYPDLIVSTTQKKKKNCVCFPLFKSQETYIVHSVEKTCKIFLKTNKMLQQIT